VAFKVLTDNENEFDLGTGVAGRKEKTDFFFFF
jgi:hypothetical protein